MLTHVLQAYANFDIETGYVQGMSCIAAALLNHILPGKSIKNIYLERKKSIYIYISSCSL
jgi:hypothetical protein